MRTRKFAGVAAALGVAIAMLSAAPAGAVKIAATNVSGLAGQYVDVAITTTDLTGWDVRSFQFELTYNANLITPTDVIEAGSLVQAAGWGDATFGVWTIGSTGHVGVSHAGSAPALSGAGTLLSVRFLVNPAQLTSSSSALTFAGFTFNEGTPNDTTTNATFTINATPIITVSPNTGEVIRTQTLAFSVSGTVSNPVTWNTTNPSIATISGAGLLTGVAPGSVRVYAVDNAGRRDTTDSDILIRGMGLTTGGGTIVVGQSISIPLTVTSLNGLGIRAGQITLGYNPAVLAPVGASAPAGTLLHGYGPMGFGMSGSTCTVDFVGSADLNGSGVLCYVTFASLQAGGAGMSVPVALFNENLPAKVTVGSISVTALPTITVNPDNVTLLAGQTQQFTLSGSPTPPITWSTLDPSVATISATGLLTAVAGGVTKVRAVDNVGATDDNTAVTVFDFAASLPTILAPPGVTVRMPILVDRNLSALAIRSMQYAVLYNATYVTQARATPNGLISVWGASGVVTNPQPGNLRVAEGGTTPVGSGSTELQVLEFDLSPSVPVGTNIPITLSGLLCNEGKPSPRVTNGVIQVRTTVDVPEAGAAAFALGRATPNPAAGDCAVRFTLPSAAERVRLAVYAVDGRRVRTLLDGAFGAGAHEARWDGRDESGASAAAGLYFFRLEWGDRTLASKFARVR